MIYFNRDKKKRFEMNELKGEKIKMEKITTRSKAENQNTLNNFSFFFSFILFLLLLF